VVQKNKTKRGVKTEKIIVPIYVLGFGIKKVDARMPYKKFTTNRG
jgi:hypothetical protein